MNVSWDDAALPSPFLPFTPLGGVVQGTNYQYILNGGSYSLATLKLSGGRGMLVSGNAVLYVAGDISISGGGYIYIAPGATFQLYVGGASSSIGGGGIINRSGIAANFSYFGLTNNTSLVYSGGAAFVGTVYAPEAHVSFCGQGSMYGACIVNSYSSVGGSSVHYDETLSGASYLALTSYTEL